MQNAMQDTMLFSNDSQIFVHLQVHFLLLMRLWHAMWLFFSQAMLSKQNKMQIVMLVQLNCNPSMHFAINVWFA